MPVSITSLQAGHTLDPISFVADAQRSRAYRAATGDTLSIYDEQNVVPPLAVAALALGAVLEVVSLPEGTLHGNEFLQAHAPVPVDATLECHARLTQRSQRGGWIISVLQSEILLDEQTVVSTRATVLSPEESA